MNPNENNGAQPSNDLPPYAQPTPAPQPAPGLARPPKGSSLRMPTHSRHHNSATRCQRRRTTHPIRTEHPAGCAGWHDHSGYEGIGEQVRGRARQASI